MTTSADEIRTAAARLRELATDATPAPWSVHHPEETWESYRDPQIIGSGKPIARANSEYGGLLNADYIAAMDPGVGTELADLLDFEADLHATAPHTTVGPRLDRVLTIARLINQEQPHGV